VLEFLVERQQPPARARRRHVGFQRHLDSNMRGG
jgi:hypothetical protein